MKKIIAVSLALSIFLNLIGQDVDYPKEVVKTLASPEFKGRGYVEDGNRIAANYIKDQYSQIGLNPFKKGYFQPFKIDVNTFPKSMKLAFDNSKLVAGKDFIVDPSSPSLNGEFSVYIINKQDLLDDNKVRNAIQSSTGKILIINERDFKTVKKEEKQKVEDIINFLKYSPNVPSSGTIIVTSEKLTWSTSTTQSSKPSFTVNNGYDIATLKKGKIEIDASLIKYKTQNIIGYVEGKEKPDSFLVVLAHYDHLGKMGSETYFPGANDNSSGVAMLLTLAKHFKANPPKYSIVFIALSAEEIGIVGAKYFVDNPLFDLKKIKFLVNFDLAGTGDDGIKVVNGSVFKTYFDILTRLNEKNSYLKSVQIRGAACNSDHCLFYDKGVPSYYIYTLGGIQAYHDIYDKSETLPLTGFTNYSKLMIDFFNNF
ncbi:MAG: M20/M25/M40 family metallo-hydrolase [Bacteroidales bacterium]|nr:M20/M25/M40 family metallo-hydrolase [Bacteroidales bacterium]